MHRQTATGDTAIDTTPRAGFRRLLLPLLLAALACNVQFGGTVRTPMGTQSAPVVFIAPTNNTILAEGASITLAAMASDYGRGVARIEFFVDDQPIGAQDAPIAEGQTTFTARIVWKAAGAQGHFISAQASRADGSKIGEAGVTVQVVAVTGVALLAGATPTDIADSATPDVSALTVPPTDTPQSTLLDLTTPDTSAALAPTAGGPTVPLITLESGPSLASATPGGAAVIAATATPDSAIATTAPPAGPPQPTLRVITPFLNVRAGPGTNFAEIGRLSSGDTATVIGRNADRTWWAIENATVRGWVINRQEYIQITGDTLNVPLAITAETPTPLPTVAQNQPLAPTSTAGAGADLFIDTWLLTPSTPNANQTFSVTVRIRNAGSTASGTALLRGVYGTDNEVSEVPIPALQPGQSITLQMPVTLRTSGTNQPGKLIVDFKGEVDEGPIGEANNERTLTFNVN